MDSIINRFGSFGRQLSDATSNFSPEAWGAIAVLTVVFGYLMLRGNMINK
jgi:hypothetical protein